MKEWRVRDLVKVDFGGEEREGFVIGIGDFGYRRLGNVR